MTVFGSSNWTSESNKSQSEHNYFTTKPWFFTWFRNNFTRKWGNTTGNAETKPFVPLPPDPPVYVSPANGATNVSTSTAATISWKPGPWAHLADIRFGTSPSPPLARLERQRLAELDEDVHAAGARAGHDLLLAGRQQDDREADRRPVPSIRSRPPRMDRRPHPRPRPAMSFSTPDERRIIGSWLVETDTTAAGGRHIRSPNAGVAKIATPLANPASYFELTFTAEAGRPYRLWIRGKADGNSYANDSVYVQFSGAVNQSGTAVYRIGTATSTEFNLEACSGCGLSGWGWEDNGWGPGVLGPADLFRLERHPDHPHPDARGRARDRSDRAVARHLPHQGPGPHEE